MKTFQITHPLDEPCAGEPHARFGGGRDREYNRLFLPLLQFARTFFLFVRFLFRRLCQLLHGLQFKPGTWVTVIEGSGALGGGVGHAVIAFEYFTYKLYSHIHNTGLSPGDTVRFFSSAMSFLRLYGWTSVCTHGPTAFHRKKMGHDANDIRLTHPFTLTTMKL